MSKADYIVTDKAGPRVAGRRAAKDDRLSLTEEEARAELLAGSIVAASEPASKAVEKPSKAR